MNQETKDPSLEEKARENETADCSLKDDLKVSEKKMAVKKFRMSQKCLFEPKTNICPYGKWNNKAQAHYCNVKGGVKKCPFDGGEAYQARKASHRQLVDILAAQ